MSQALLQQSWSKKIANNFDCFLVGYWLCLTDNSKHEQREQCMSHHSNLHLATPNRQWSIKYKAIKHKTNKDFRY